MAQENPYAAPSSTLTVEDGVEFGNPAVFSLSSRAGRLRYLARVGLGTFTTYLVIGLVVGDSALTGEVDPNANVLGALGYLLAVLISVGLALLFASQRLRDLNHTGWMSLLLLVPIVNAILGLYLLFGRGTPGANKYGLPPPPNTIGVQLAALIFPLILVIGVIAAIAIPAYQDYAVRAQEAQQFQMNAE